MQNDALAGRGRQEEKVMNMGTDGIPKTKPISPVLSLLLLWGFGGMLDGCAVMTSTAENRSLGELVLGLPVAGILVGILCAALWIAAYNMRKYSTEASLVSTLTALIIGLLPAFLGFKFFSLTAFGVTAAVGIGLSFLSQSMVNDVLKKYFLWKANEAP